MGYFPNGTSGEDYYERWCARCLHEKPEQVLCPVWALHLTHNYAECNKPDSFLHVLIPKNDDKLRNERCSMFVDRGLLSNLALQKFEHDARPALPATEGGGT